MTYEEDLFIGVNKPKDPNNLTDLEKKHLPIIETPESVEANTPFEVTVTVGKLLTHPNTEGHHIQFVELYADRVYLARVDFTPVLTEPTAKLEIALSKSATLRAFERCNLHGVWEYDKAISVV